MLVWGLQCTDELSVEIGEERLSPSVSGCRMGKVGWERQLATARCSVGEVCSFLQ